MQVKGRIIKIWTKENGNTCAIYEAPKEIETLNGKSRYFFSR